MSVNPNKHKTLFRYERPAYYYSHKNNELKGVKPVTPALCWGYGHSPALKD